MADAHLTTRAATVRRLARRGMLPALARVVAKTRPEDLAALVAGLPPVEQRVVFGQIEDQHAAATVLAALVQEDLEPLARVLSPERLAALFAELDPKDQTDLLARLPEDLHEAVLTRIHHEEREQVEELMSWPPDTAGGIMSPLAFRVKVDSTCRDAIMAAQQASERELIYYLYVETEEGQLAGVTSLRTLLSAAPSDRLGDLMNTDVIAVRPEMDQEEVARIADRYNLIAVPVVDESRRLLGIVTVDDVLRVLREEAAEDMLLVAGVSHHGADRRLGASMRRLPWLVVTAVSGLVASELVRALDLVADPRGLVAFLPAVAMLPASVAVQAGTVTVRTVALGRLDVSVPRTLLTELRRGAVMGLAAAVLLGGWAGLRTRDLGVVESLAGASILASALAAVAGAAVPHLALRLRQDPAMVIGPFLAGVLSAVGLACYLGLLQLVG